MSELELRVGLFDAESEERYLQALNACFPGWGDRAAFDWCFRRRMAERMPDLLTLWRDGALIAGSAITYRNLRLPSNAIVCGAIMTGSWTDPSARRSGAFTRMIDESVRIARGAGASLLLGFGRTENVSYRRLVAAGSAIFPAFQCRSSQASEASAGEIHVTGVRHAGLPIDAFQAPTGRTGLWYGSVDEWRSQFVERPGGEVDLVIADDVPVLVQRTSAADRVLAVAVGGLIPRVVAGLRNRAVAAGRELFIYTSSAEEVARLQRDGFVVTEAFISALPLDPAKPGPDACTNPGSPLYLGEWSVQNGDRM